jgi:hypothetical protein
MTPEIFHTGTDLDFPVSIDPRVKYVVSPIKGTYYFGKLPKWKPVPRPDKES